jgi:hypothetical protein
VEPTYGQRTPQSPTPVSDAPLLDAKRTRRIQAIAGTFLFYARAVDPTILPALNELATEQAAPTTDTEAKAIMLMDYLATHPNATIRYHASDMVLHVESDAAYLVLPKARSRAAGHYFFSNTPPPAPQKPNPTPNGPVHTLCKTIKNVMSSAAESETGGVYLNGKESIPIRTTAKELGHPQPPTPLKTDNTTAHGILTKTLRPKLSKAFDMRFHWMKDRIQQKQFNLFWEKGSLNMADYFTKHHPPRHHKLMRHKYLHNENPKNTRHDCAHATINVRGCVTTSGLIQSLYSTLTSSNAQPTILSAQNAKLLSLANSS